MSRRIGDSVAVAVHVRFFDSPNEIVGNSVANNTPQAYYARAVEQLETCVPDAHYFIFSDQPEAARSCIPLPEHRLTYVSHNQGDDDAYADLWLMAQCQHFIIANSTFSWWGAWLAASPDKLVVAPGFEKRDGVSWWGFKGLLPEEWITC